MRLRNLNRYDFYWLNNDEGIDFLLEFQMDSLVEFCFNSRCFPSDRTRSQLEKIGQRDQSYYQLLKAINISKSLRSKSKSNPELRERINRTLRQIPGIEEDFDILITKRKYRKRSSSQLSAGTI